MKYNYLVIGISLLGLATAYNNCGQVQFQPSAASSTVASASTGTGTTTSSTPSCDANSFGSVCSGTTNNPPTTNVGAHGYFYNLAPIADSNGYAAGVGAYAGDHISGSMNLLTAQTIIPDLSLFTTEINVPLQAWTTGFPGHTNLQEWFGVCYDGSWTAPTSGTYTFVTAVDDSMALWIDGNLVGENDDGSIHSNIVARNPDATYTANAVAFQSINLSAGQHTVEVMYYQGWPVILEAQLWSLPPGASFQSGKSPANEFLMQLGSPVNGALNCPH